MKTKADVLKSLLNKEVYIESLDSGGLYIWNKPGQYAGYNYTIIDIGEDVFTAKQPSNTTVFSIDYVKKIVIS